MKVGFDATTLVMRRSGIGRYTLELLQALLRTEPELDITLMTHRPLSPGLDLPASSRVRRMRGPGLPIKLPWMQLLLPLELAFDRPDLCHFTNYYAPLFNPVRSVINLHDMSLFLMPEYHPRRRVWTARPLTRTVAHRASAVICLTDAARDDAVRVLDIDPAKVWVVPAAPTAIFRPIDDQAVLDEVAARYVVGRGFLLFVGTIEPRKNLVRLVHAYARLRRSGFDQPLVICGGWGWKSADLLATINQLDLTKHVRFTGFVDDADLAALLNLARAFVYPSLYEGFGLPIIEAFACGTPVVTSDRGATAEVAGGAALVCQPEDIDALTASLACALFDEEIRAELRAAGLRRTAQFTWDRTAHETAAVYRAVLQR